MFYTPQGKWAASQRPTGGFMKWNPAYVVCFFSAQTAWIIWTKWGWGGWVKGYRKLIQSSAPPWMINKYLWSEWQTTYYKSLKLFILRYWFYVTPADLFKKKQKQKNNLPQLSSPSFLSKSQTRLLELLSFLLPGEGLHVRSRCFILTRFTFWDRRRVSLKIWKELDW